MSLIIMDVFDLRDRLVGDYASYTRSFNALLHYDLACYPTRYEQREGRVTIEPVLPVDILGAYVLVPIPGAGGA